MAGLQRCQEEAEAVVQLVGQNLAKALEREGKLSELDGRAAELHAMGRTFTRTSRAVGQRRGAGRRRWLLLAALAAGLGLLVGIVALALWLRGGGGDGAAPPAGTQQPVTEGRSGATAP